jgi:hypothetical protein
MARKDVREEKLTRWEASKLISSMKKEKSTSNRQFILDVFLKKRDKVEPPPEAQTINVRNDQLALLERAREAGVAAMQKITPKPMVVQQHANPMDDSSEVTDQWFVPQGVCGFAWVVVKCKGPGVKFINALKREGLAGGENSHKEFSRSSYHKGFYHHIHEGGQSYELKVAYANAFAGVLKDHGIECYAGSRLD